MHSAGGWKLGESDRAAEVTNRGRIPRSVLDEVWHGTNWGRAGREVEVLQSERAEHSAAFDRVQLRWVDQCVGERQARRQRWQAQGRAAGERGSDELPSRKCSIPEMGMPEWLVAEAPPPDGVQILRRYPHKQTSRAMATAPP